MFDFAAADAMGERLEALRRALVTERASRADAAALITGWTGARRAAHDERRAAHEGVLTHHGVDQELARLRAAWDEAARAQRKLNRPGRSSPG